VSAASASAVPWRWTDPWVAKEECFRRETDVWAFGVCMWEMLSRGARPYEDIEDTRSVLNFVSGGGRLTTPDFRDTGIEADSDTVDALALVMADCWNENFSERPTFKQLAHDLKRLGQKTVAPEGLSRADVKTGQPKEYSLITTVGHGEYTGFGIASSGGNRDDTVPAHYGSIVDGEEKPVPAHYGSIGDGEKGRSNYDSIVADENESARGQYDSIIDGNEVEASDEEESDSLTPQH
jgi:Protein tyrosine and serine/threonine kinase